MAMIIWFIGDTLEMHFQRLEELDEIERWRKMARIDAIFFYAYPTVHTLMITLFIPAENLILQAFALFNLIYWPYWVLMPNAHEFLSPDATAEDS